MSTTCSDGGRIEARGDRPRGAVSAEGGLFVATLWDAGSRRKRYVGSDGRSLVAKREHARKWGTVGELVGWFAERAEADWPCPDPVIERVGREPPFKRIEAVGPVRERLPPDRDYRGPCAGPIVSYAGPRAWPGGLPAGWITWEEYAREMKARGQWR